MSTWKKYEFTATAWGTLKKTIQVTTDEGTNWDSEKVAGVIEMGKLCKAWTTNAEGEQVCSSYSTRLSVDIVWNVEPLAGFAAYEVNPAAGTEAMQILGQVWGQ
jgi:hypothetical protein